MNESARGGMDLMVRDMLQVGSGLPSSHSIGIPNGDGSERIRIPGPPGTAFQTAIDDLVLPAVMPRNGAGPLIGDNNTDVVTILMADNSFVDVTLTAVSDSTVTVAAGPDLGDGPDRVVPGQLMMISKGATNTLVQVTDVDADTRVLRFDDDDSLRLNQSEAEFGNLPALNATDPVDDPDTVGVFEDAAATRISRIRMITYYLDDTDAVHPRLVRRINNGHPGNFDNELGTAVALDVVNLQFTYDISNGAGNPGGVEMNAADLALTGSCAPVACAETQIRKVNLMLRSRPANPNQVMTNNLNNLLETQVSLRAMAFVDRYQ
jgi:hypothetical protein